MLKISGPIPIAIYPFFWILAAAIGWLNTFNFPGTLIWMVIIVGSVLVHEFGHVLGLGHVPDETDSVMYPYLNIGPDASNKNYSSSISTVKTTLSPLDVSRIKSIYNP